MALSIGDSLPEAELLRIGAEGPEAVSLSSLSAGKKIVIFGLPGAFTGTCTAAHLPSFMRNEAALREKGVDEIICVSVNDPFVMDAWGKSTGADQTGIHLLADGDASFTKAMGQEFTAPPVAFYDRSKRYACVADDGKITLLNLDEKPGTCDLSAGEAVLDAI